MIVTARHHLDSCWVELTIRGDRIVETPRVEGPEPIGPEDDWVAPAFWDIQINGRWGHSFSSPELTVEQVAEIVRAQATLGTARLCPTLITAPAESMRHGVRTIAAACDAVPRHRRAGRRDSPRRAVPLGARWLSRCASNRRHA